METIDPYTEHIDINLSIMVVHNEDRTFTAYPEHADYVRYTEDSFAGAVREVLSATADLYEEEGEKH
jgi:hypothetical protein